MLVNILIKPPGFICKNPDVAKSHIFLRQIILRGEPSNESDLVPDLVSRTAPVSAITLWDRSCDHRMFKRLGKITRTENVAYTYNGLLCSLKKEENCNTCYNMGEP